MRSSFNRIATFAVAMAGVLVMTPMVFASGDIYIAGLNGVWQYDESGNLRSVMRPDLNVVSVRSGADNSSLYVMGGAGISRIDLLSGSSELIVESPESLSPARLPSFEGFAIGEDDYIFVDGLGTRSISVYDPVIGKHVAEVTGVSSSDLEFDRESGKLVIRPHQEPTVVALDERDLNISFRSASVDRPFSLDPFGKEVYYEKYDGQNAGRYVYADDPTRFYEVNGLVTAVSLDPHGNLYYADVMTNARKVSPDGQVTQFPNPEGALVGPIDILYRPFLNRVGDERIPLTVRDLTLVAREVADGRVRDELDFDASGNIAAEELIAFFKSEEIAVGDVDLNGVFDSGDLLEVFQLGRFESDSGPELDWSMGDFDGDRKFSTRDLVMAFVAGDYQATSPGAVNSLPEPGGLSMLVVGVCLLLRASRRNRREKTRRA